MVSCYGFVHVVPVGISLLSSFQGGFSNVVEEWGFSGWDLWALDDSRLEKFSEYLSTKGYGVSAELTPLSKAVSLFGNWKENTIVFLFSTSTCNPRLVRDAIAGFLRRKGFHLQVTEIRGTGSAEEFDEGLMELMDNVV